MADIKTLVKQRGIIKSKLTRFTTYFNSVSKPDEVTQLKLRLQKIEECWLDFDKIQTEIECEDNSPEQFDERDRFESEYFSITSSALDFIAAHGKNEKTTECDIKPQIWPDISVKLPDIQLPTFFGDYDQWLSFHDTFTSIIDSKQSMPSVHKFHYLKCCLKGEAAKIVQSLESSGENYSVAWKLLCDRYGNKKYLINKHVNALFNLKKIDKGNSASLRDLLDTTLKHIRALNSLGQPTDQWDTLLIHLVTTKLDLFTLREWENKLDANNLPTMSQLEKFLQHKCQVLESVENNKQTDLSVLHKAQSKIKSNKNNSGTSSCHLSIKKCSLCDKAHPIYFCEKFKLLPVHEREKEVRKLALCFNCLGSGHKTQDCKSSSCKVCGKKHNSLLHYTENNSPVLRSVTSTSLKTSISILLSTAIVSVLDNYGNSHLLRVLLDSGSQSNFITERAALSLKLKKHAIVSEINGINSSSTTATHSVQCTISSRLNSFSTNLDCIILPTITQHLPNSVVLSAELNIPSNLQLADPQFWKPSQIDMLLGAEIFFDILQEGKLRLADSKPTLQNSVFGWLVSGKFHSNVPKSKNLICNVSVLERIDTHLQNFWRIESVDKPSQTFLEQNEVEKHFLENCKRDSNGRFIVRLPLKDKQLGDSKNTAIRRFKNQERKLLLDPLLKEKYVSFMKEYEELGHMVVIPEDNSNTSNRNIYYLPHHSVINESSPTTKLRVVFDGSCKTSNGVSVNDIHKVGPVVQDDLINILLRFRKHRYVVTADIEKMYRMVKVDEADVDLQRIIWRYTPEQELKTYGLTTLTYGTASAAYLATRCLKQLAIEEQERFPNASSVTLTDFYVDDLLTGSDNIQNLINLQSEIIEMLRNGGFELKKWCSNSHLLLEAIPQSHQHSNYALHSGDCAIKTLGVTWEPTSDTFSFSIKYNKILLPVTKRKILSQIASIFDPLGLLGPIILKAKLFLQRLWEIKTDWDDPIPEKTSISWIQYSEDLQNLKLLRVARRVIPNDFNDVQLHGFSDASETAYGACIYVRSRDSNNKVFVNLLCSKSRVAPIKRVSIPRLELCAAVLLSKLFQRVKSTFPVNFSKCVLWTDSTVVLSWINSSSLQWKPFVSNRVSEIQELSSYCQWRHVNSKDNPADLISRGLLPSQIAERSLWWNGPDWLKGDEESWPRFQGVNTAETLERRSKPCLFMCVNSDEIINKYSSYNKLLRVIAYCIRFKNNCLASSNRNLGYLSNEELIYAEIVCVKIVQKIEFNEEIADLSKSKTVSNKSRLKTLNPFLDKNNIIRVGGRISHSNLNFDQKHPIMLPGNHNFTKLIFKHEHIRQMHAGPQLLLASVRSRYWPLNGRNLARKVVHECIKCFRVSAKSTAPLMGDLPASRLQPQRPFFTCGVDFCGPIQIRSNRLRKCQHTKGYIAVFVCFSVKAVHLELVGDLTTDSFIGALRRLMARRGKVQNIYSDNATNFTGANHELNELHKLFSTTNHQNKLHEFLAEDRINWHFIPPRAPHFGGLWEAAVKSCKYHLRRIVGNTVLTYEEFNTYLTQVESCLNSRPLTPLSSDPADYSPLTPGHFLIGDSLTAPPEPNLVDTPINKLTRWQLVQQRLQHFWSRWSKEYLTSLQQRSKWYKDNPPLELGELVVIKEDNLPPLKWILGRIMELHPGADRRHRVAIVKTSSGIFKRPITKLCPLPKEQ